MLNQNAARNAHARTALLNPSINVCGSELNAFHPTSINARFETLGTGSNAYWITELGHTSSKGTVIGYKHGLLGEVGDPTSPSCHYEVRTIRGIPQGEPVVVTAHMQSPVVTPAEMVTFVRNTFMLTVSDASKVFRVSRPTIYQWGNLTDIDQVRARNDRERMKELYRLSLDWKGRKKLTGRWAFQVLRNGKSVVDLLSAESINHQAVLEAYGQLMSNSETLRQAEIARSTRAVNALARAFDRMGTNEKRRERGKPEPLP